MKKIDQWKNKPITQQPNWSDQNQLNLVLQQIRGYPTLVVEDEIKLLKKDLIDAANGNSFIIQGGDCAETFEDFSAPIIKNKIKILLQLSAIIKYLTKLNIINIGRIAGQFAKPRTHEFEIRGKTKLPSYRGDAVNDIKFTKASREARPNRLVQAYHQSAATMNLIRSLIMEGYTDFQNIQSWGLSFLEKTHYVKKYNSIAKNIKEVLEVTSLSSIDNFYSTNNRIVNSIYTSHELLLLDFEEAFIRYNKEEDSAYNCSAHMLWIGDRTRNINGAHIAFASQIGNPIGLKIGPEVDINQIPKLCMKLNPNNEVGKLVLIIRLGLNYIDSIFSKIIKIINQEKINIIWMCDPMHGNTITTKSGYKTRSFNTIQLELEKFFKICYNEDVIPAGVHIELTGENVTECIGGMNNIQDTDLNQYYQTACDPRLNNEQSLEMAFSIADYINKGEK